MRRAFRPVDGRLPWAIGVPAVVVVLVLVLGYRAFAEESPRSSVAQRMYAAVDLFAGNYLRLEGQPQVPSPTVAGLGLVALGLTFLAALTAVFSLTARARDRWRARRAGSDLVVLGGGAAAAEVLRPFPSSRRGLLLVTDSSQGPAAVAARRHAAVKLADLEALTDKDAASLRRRGKWLAVATDDDALNLGLAERLTRTPLAGSTVMTVVRHPVLVEELRPPVIRGRLQLPFSISCPAENIAEQVCLQLDRMLDKDVDLRAAGSGTVVIDGDGGALAETVETWVRRFTWSRSFLSGGAGIVLPRLRMGDETSPGRDGPVVRILVGEEPADTAARTLRGLRAARPADRFVAVTSRRLLFTHRADRVVVVDDRAAAWDHALVFDDIESQWGRLYHAIYGVLFDNMTDWADVATGREGQSSVLAGRFMLENLEQHGFELVKCEGPPRQPDFTPAEVTSMAAAEHHQWLNVRTYREGGREISVARLDSEYRVPWEELDGSKRHDNEALVVSTVPALAALFGYEVRRIAAAQVPASAPSPAAAAG